MVGADPRNDIRGGVPAGLRRRARRPVQPATGAGHDRRCLRADAPAEDRRGRDGPRLVGHRDHRHLDRLSLVPREEPDQSEIAAAGESGNEGLARIRHGMERAHRLALTDSGHRGRIYRAVLRHESDSPRPGPENDDHPFHPRVRMRRGRGNHGRPDHQVRTGALKEPAMSTTTERPQAPVNVPDVPEADKPEGPISAAIIAAGVGALALGILTTLSEASTGFNTWLNWHNPVGPLSGKTILAVIAWIVAWAALHVAMRRTEFESRRALIIALVLIGLGVLGTFPTFFQ